MNKSQFSAIDFLIVIIFVIFTTLYLNSLSTKIQLESESIRYQNTYSQHLLFSLMNYEVKEYNNMTVFDLLILYLCDGDSKINKTLSREIKKVIDLLKRDSYNYIFYAEGNFTIKVFDKFPSVCLQDISIASIENLKCNSKIIFGSWNKNLNVREVC